jgi:hypothetical protein
LGVNAPTTATPGPCGPSNRERSSASQEEVKIESLLDISLNLASCHLLSHVKQETPVVVFDATHEPPKLAQKTSIFPDAAPDDIVSALALGEVGEDGWFFSVVEKLIEWDFQSARHFFERFDGRNGMAIFNAGDIATKQSCALFDVTLGKLFFLAHGAKPVADNHCGIVS